MNDSNVWSQGISSLALPEVLSFYFGGMSDDSGNAVQDTWYLQCIARYQMILQRICQGHIRKDPRVIARAVKRALQLIHGPPPRSRISFLMCLMSISNFQALRTQPRGV